jgi:hypothetical protein
MTGSLLGRIMVPMSEEQIDVTTEQNAEGQEHVRDRMLERIVAEDKALLDELSRGADATD